MYDVDGNSLDVARHPKEIIKIPIVGDFSRYDLMRKKQLTKVRKCSMILYVKKD